MVTRGEKFTLAGVTFVEDPARGDADCRFFNGYTRHGIIRYGGAFQVNRSLVAEFPDTWRNGLAELARACFDAEIAAERRPNLN